MPPGVDMPFSLLWGSNKLFVFVVRRLRCGFAAGALPQQQLLAARRGLQDWIGHSLSAAAAAAVAEDNGAGDGSEAGAAAAAAAVNAASGAAALAPLVAAAALLEELLPAAAPALAPGGAVAGVRNAARIYAQVRITAHLQCAAMGPPPQLPCQMLCRFPRPIAVLRRKRTTICVQQSAQIRRSRISECCPRQAPDLAEAVM